MSRGDTSAHTATLRVGSSLDYSTYRTLLDEAARLREAGFTDLRIDMSPVRTIGTSGLVALYAVAQLFDGRTPPNLNCGWDAIRSLAEASCLTGDPAVELTGLQANVRRALFQAGLKDRFRLPLES